MDNYWVMSAGCCQSVEACSSSIVIQAKALKNSFTQPQDGEAALASAL
ncbi:MAG TPA: hypothetical protein V6C50_13650 [Crinalium sp.]